MSEGEGLRLEIQWWEQVVRSVFEGIAFPKFEDFFQELYQYFGQGQAWRLFPETEAVVAHLKGEGYTLGIISNFDSRLPTICKDLGIWEGFDTVLISSREGKAKPAPEIFEAALAHTGLLPSEAIHVGDHLENDVKGAKKIGMAAILVDRAEGAKALNPSITRIADLRGISDLLNRGFGDE